MSLMKNDHVGLGVWLGGKAFDQHVCGSRFKSLAPQNSPSLNAVYAAQECATLFTGTLRGQSGICSVKVPKFAWV